jgi:hypothetical protein
MPDHNRINPAAFIFALILAPLVTGLPAFALIWLLIIAEIELSRLSIVVSIPAMATVVGAPTYLTFGTVAFVLALRSRRDGGGHPVVWYAFIANLASAPAIFFVFLLTYATDELMFTVFFIGFGLIFAPLWGWIFGALYARFTKAMPTRGSPAS